MRHSPKESSSPDSTKGLRSTTAGSKEDSKEGSHPDSLKNSRGTNANSKPILRLDSNAKIFAACAVLAGLLAVVLAYAQIFSNSMVQQTSQIAHGSAGTSGLMIFVGAAVVAWGFSIHLRCSDAYVRLNLKIIAVLLVLWLLDVLVKYPVTNDLAESILWYLFYLPMLFIPTLCMSSGIRVAALDDKPVFARLKKAAYAVDAILFVLVLTNNLHHLVFAFDFVNPNWGSDYKYELLYWPVILWQLVQYGAFFAVSISAAQKQSRNTFAPLIIIILLGVAYSVLYGLKSAGVFQTNFSLTYTILLVAALELCLDFGILPSYRRYTKLFAQLPFNLFVLNAHGDVVYQTEAATHIPSAAMQNIYEFQNMSPPGALASAQPECRDFRVAEVPHTRFRVYRVAGGVAVLMQNVESEDARRQQLFVQLAKLERRGEMLSRERDVRYELYHQMSNRQLFDDIERSLATKTARINEIVASLPKSDDGVDGATYGIDDAVHDVDGAVHSAADAVHRADESTLGEHVTSGTGAAGAMDERASTHSECSQEELRQRLNEVRLLIAYCKRKGALVLTDRTDEDFDRDRLQLVFNETASDLRSIGVECAAIVQTSRALHASTMSVLYDCLYDFATLAFWSKNPVLLIYVSSSAGSSTEGSGSGGSNKEGSDSEGLSIEDAGRKDSSIESASSEGLSVVEMRAILQTHGEQKVGKASFEQLLLDLKSKLSGKNLNFKLDVSQNEVQLSVQIVDAPNVVGSPAQTMQRGV